MALEPGHGRTAVPVRSAIAGTIVAVVAVVAAAVFGTSLLGLVNIPHRYGQNWTQKVDFVLPAAPGSLLAQVMAGQPGVHGYAQGVYGQMAVNGQDVPAIGVDPVRGPGFLTAPAGPPAQPRAVPAQPGLLHTHLGPAAQRHPRLRQGAGHPAGPRRAARRARGRHAQPRPAGRGPPPPA